MPEGVAVEVEDGLATVQFVDGSKRGEGIAALLDAAGDPALVQKRTRPVSYIVPEDVARAAGLLDDEVVDDAPAEPDDLETWLQAEAQHHDDVEAWLEAEKNGAEAHTAEGTGTPNDGVEVQPGETGELTSEDTGGPYTDLPEVENPDGTVELEPSGAPADHVVGDPAPTQGYDDGKPDMDWSRKAINDYAAALTPPLDVTGFGNKRDAISAIKAATGAPASSNP